MRKLVISIIFLFLFSIPVFSQNIKVQGVASKGGKIVRTSAQVQHTLMETYPLCTITIYLTGTLTLAPIFTNEIGTPKSNPFTAASDASFSFYVAIGRYDIKFSGTGIISPFTISDVFVEAGGGGGGSTVDSFNGRTGTVVPQAGDYTYSGLDFTGSNFNSIITRSASDLNAGTLPSAVFPTSLPVISGSNITDINATNITLGTLDDVRLSSNIPKKNVTNTFTQDNIFTTNVGINTTIPRRRLDVLDGSNAQVRLTSVDNSAYADLFVDSGGGLNFLPTGNIAFDATGNQVNPLNNFDQNLGQINKKWLSLHAAELVVETLVAQNTVATIGGRIIVAPTNMLIADLSPAATSISVKYNNLNNGDRVYMEGNSSVEFFAVTSGASVISGGFSYTVTRNLDGTGANQWFAGDAIVNTGVSGNGFIDIYSTRGVKSSAQIGPTIVGNVRNSTTYNDWTENWAIGNLNGLYGYGSDTYGVALGKYAASPIYHITIDPSNGIRIFDGLSQINSSWDSNGITIGGVGIGLPNIRIAAGSLAIRSNTTERIKLNPDGSGFVANNLVAWDSAGNLTITNANLRLSGASSSFSIGISPPPSSSSGTGIFIDRTGIYALTSGILQVKLDAVTGAILAGEGFVSLDAGGLNIGADTNFKTNASINFNEITGGLLIGALKSAYGSNNTTVNLIAQTPIGNTSGKSTLRIGSGTNGNSPESSLVFTNYGFAHATHADKKLVAVSSVTSILFTTNAVAAEIAESFTPSTLLELRSTVGALLLTRVTSTERDALTATNGMIIYNTTTDKLQVRAAGAWVDLH